MKTSTRVIHWIPRILCIIAILFISLFALDSFSSDRTIWQNLAAFLMHLIPSFVLLGVLIVAWKWEMVGGIILTITGIILFIALLNFNYRQRHFSLAQSLINVSLLCMPFIIAGILFIVSYNKMKFYNRYDTKIVNALQFLTFIFGFVYCVCSFQYNKLIQLESQ